MVGRQCHFSHIECSKQNFKTSKKKHLQNHKKTCLCKVPIFESSGALKTNFDHLVAFIYENVAPRVNAFTTVKLYLYERIRVMKE